MSKEAAKITAEQKNLVTPEESRERKNSIKYKRDKDREKVKGIFRNYETRGGMIKFPIRLYPGDEIETHTLIDGQTYSIPLGVAKHLNKNCYIEQHAAMPDGTIQGIGTSGRAMTVVNKIKRFGFQSLEFVDDEDMNMNDHRPSDIVGVKLS